MTYQTIAFCVEPGCRCDDSGGKVLYAGPSREDAERATLQAPAAYECEIVERAEPTEAGRY